MGKLLLGDSRLIALRWQMRTALADGIATTYRCSTTSSPMIARHAGFPPKRERSLISETAQRAFQMTPTRSPTAAFRFFVAGHQMGG